MIVGWLSVNVGVPEYHPFTMEANGPDDAEIAARVDRLIDEHRMTCLWFLRPDYHPSTNEERIRVLQHIEKHGDLDAFRRAASLRRWLLPTSSVASVDS